MKFGILGEAKIAREHVVPAILAAGHEVTHVGKRNPGQKPLPSVYKDAIETDYESLLSEPSIDAIYIPLPNHLHVPYSIKALEFGKHVLCEKPVALNLDELMKLELAAKESGAFFYEAYMVRSIHNGFGLISLILENTSLLILFLAILNSLKVTFVIVKLMVVALYMTLVVTLYCQAVYFLKVILKSSQRLQ